MSCHGDSACSSLVLCLAVSRLQGSSGRGWDPTPLPPRRVQLSPRPPRPSAARSAVFSCPGFVRSGVSGAREFGDPKPGRALRSPRPHSWASAVSTRVDSARSARSPDMDAVPLWSPLSLLLLLLLSGTRGERSGQEPRLAVGWGLACARLQPWPRLSTPLWPPAP